LQHPLPGEPTGAWARARVLVVDENETARRLIRQHLTDWTLTAETAASAASALDLLRREQKAGRPFDLVLVDMHLPDLDAAVFVRQVRDLTGLAIPKLMVMSAAELDIATAHALGFNAVLLKPVQPEPLSERLALLINTKARAA